MGITTKCRFPLLRFFKTVLLKCVPCFLTHFSLFSLSPHSLPSLSLLLTDSNVVLPLSPNLSSSAGPLLHLVGSLLLQQPAVPRGRDGEHREPGLGHSPRLCLITQLRLTLKPTVYFTKCQHNPKLLLVRPDHCTKSYSSQHLWILQNITTVFFSYLYQTKVNAHQQLDINTQRASPD